MKQKSLVLKNSQLFHVHTIYCQLGKVRPRDTRFLEQDKMSVAQNLCNFSYL